MKQMIAVAVIALLGLLLLAGLCVVAWEAGGDLGWR